MSTNTSLPPIVSAEEWQGARAAFLTQEKAATDASDALAAARRRLPMTRIEKDYTFQSPSGPLSLADLFENRTQLLLYHFMFAPDVGGWPDAGCVGCSMFADQVPHLAHLHARDTTMCFVSVAPLENLLRYQQRMGWTFPWYSSAGSTFNQDFGLTTAEGEEHGISVFIRDGAAIYRTYFTKDRGAETLGSIWGLLDITPLGRQETWEDTPAGRPQTDPFKWWRRHDEY